MGAISQLTSTLTSAGIGGSRSNIWLIVDKTDEGTPPGTSMKINLTELHDNFSDLASLLVAADMVRAGHGRVSGDMGKPITEDGALYDDANAAHFPVALVESITDVDTIKICVSGRIAELPIALLEGGVAFNPSIGRNVWWDKSANGAAGLYRQARQTDAIKLGPMLMVLEVGVSTFTAFVRTFGATPLIPIPPKLIDSTDVTNKTTTLLAANQAIAAPTIFVNGIVINSEDATFNPATGVLSWTGLDMAEVAFPGMAISGMYEPK